MILKIVTNIENTCIISSLYGTVSGSIFQIKAKPCFCFEAIDLKPFHNSIFYLSTKFKQTTDVLLLLKTILMWFVRT